MRERGGGRIVNIASDLAVTGMPGYVDYSAAKQVSSVRTRGLAVELAPTVLVNAVAPGPVDTPMMDRELSTDPNPEAARPRRFDAFHSPDRHGRGDRPGDPLPDRGRVICNRRSALPRRWFGCYEQTVRRASRGFVVNIEQSYTAVATRYDSRSTVGLAGAGCNCQLSP